jgi:hypothetical protein
MVAHDREQIPRSRNMKETTHAKATAQTAFGWRKGLAAAPWS